MEYPDYKYQPRKRPATTTPFTVDSDSLAGSRPHRRPISKRLRGAKNSRRKKSSKVVPQRTRSETPMSSADSDLSSELAESYLSSDWSVADDLEEDDEYDLDVIGTHIPTYISTTESSPNIRNPETSSVVFSLPSASICSQVPIREPIAVLPTSCGRSTGILEAFDWMEDYMTPEVVDLLADDWLVAADNICLRDVAVM